MKRRRWRGLRDELSHQKLQFISSQISAEDAHGQVNQTSNNVPLSLSRQAHLLEEITDVQRIPSQTNHLISQRSCSASCLSQYWQIDLFMANVSRFISFSDQKRHASVELRSVTSGNSNEPVILQCSTEELACQWFDALQQTIESQIENFVCF